MNSLERQIAFLRRRNRELALDGTRAIMDLASNVTPELLQQVQDEIRAGLLWAERRIRSSQTRADTWKVAQRKRFHCIPELARRRSGRRPSMQERDQLLIEQRGILRQLGDACAWLVLKSNPRLIRALFSETRTHHLSGDPIGLVGPIAIANAAHASGRFLVIENDLTRCLGIGDITVVGYTVPWSRPLSLEIKTKGEFREGEEAHIDLVLAESEHPVDSSLFREFVETLGLQTPADPEIPSNARKQAEELKERADILLRLTTEVTTKLARPRKSLWPIIGNVLNRASVVGVAYDLAGEGIGFAAIRVGDAERNSGTPDLQRLFADLRDLRLTPHSKKQAAMNSHEFIVTEAVSAMAPPIALWPVDLTVRASLLSGELFFFCFYDPDVWMNAFHKEGIDVEEIEGHWRLVSNGEAYVLDPLEVGQIHLGLAFGGLHPTDVAKRTAEAFGMDQSKSAL